MPNYVTNILTINGTSEEIKVILNDVKSDFSLFDFNKIVPMPEDLKINANNFLDCLDSEFSILSGMKDNANKLKDYLSRLDSDSKEKELNNFIQGIKNYINYGFATWYGWSINNWSTKWNALEVTVNDNVINFQTAWSSPKKIFKVLSKKYPDVIFDLIYADEDTSSNCGKEKYKNGEIIEKYYPESQTKEAYELTFEVLPDKQEYFKLINGNYEYIDE